MSSETRTSLVEPRIGIDLGGTKIEGVILTGPGNNPQIHHRQRIPTEAHKGYDHILNRTATFIKELVQLSSSEAQASVGLGMPGSITDEGRIKNSNTVCLNNTLFRQELQDLLECKIVFDNDANCFALAEATLGAGKDKNLVFGVIMGTGVGGGIVIDGNVRVGLQSICGEWGHMVLHPTSPRECYCGAKGCVETYLAGPKIEQHYQQLAGAKLPLESIVQQARSGDTNAAESIELWMDSFGRALANVINILDPDIVVLGGGVSNASILYDQGITKTASYVFNDNLQTPIVKNQLGDSAGVLGAALIARAMGDK